MIKFESCFARTLLALLGATLPGIAAAADAGTVLFASGSVTAEREPAIALNKGDLVLDNDTIVTGDASRAQLLMVDAAKIAIRPNSVLRIDEYTYQEAAATVVTESADKSVMSLVKGGFRTITGAVGKEDNAAYEVRTPVGVLGIRGTNFAVLLCSGDCADAPNVAPGAPIEDGVYIAVTEGTVVFRTRGDEIVVTAGEYAFIPMATQQPRLIDTPPQMLIDDEMRLEENDNANLSGFDSKLGTRRSPDTGKPGTPGTEPGDGDSSEAPQQPVIGIDADGSPIDITPGDVQQQRIGRLIGYASAPLGFAVAHSAAQFNEPGSVQLDSSNNVLGFTAPFPGGFTPSPISIGTSSNVDTGFDSLTVLRWGRWSGGTADALVTDDAGNTSNVSVDLGNQSLHWISGPDQTPPALPVTGVASYSLLGSTSPTDNLGNVGVLGSATFDADFISLTVASTLTIDIAGLTWMASGTGNLGAAAGLPAHLFSGNYSAVVIGGQTTGSGQFSGFFSEPGTSSDPAIPGGVGLSYSLQDGQGTTSVSGTAAFGNP